jgi:hypothetical protein
MDLHPYGFTSIIPAVSWTVLFHDEFDSEFQTFAEGLQDELLAHSLLLSEFGPSLGRPTVDTLSGSKHANMKELRFGWQGQVWRVAFAFDPNRQALLLVAGDKGGADQKRFYKRLIGLADARFDTHLASLAAARARKEKRHAKKS